MKLCQAKLCEQLHPPVFNPSLKHLLITFQSLWSSTDSLLAENNRNTWHFLCSSMGIIQCPWILLLGHYLLHIPCTYFLAMMPAENVTVDDFLNVLLPASFLALLLLMCYFPKQGCSFSACIWNMDVIDETLWQKGTTHNFKKMLDCWYAYPKPCSGTLDLGTNNSCVYSIEM